MIVRSLVDGTAAWPMAREVEPNKRAKTRMTPSRLLNAFFILVAPPTDFYGCN